MMKFESIKLLTHKKDYMYDGSSKLHKRINSIKFKKN